MLNSFCLTAMSEPADKETNIMMAMQINGKPSSTAFVCKEHITKNELKEFLLASIESLLHQNYPNF